MPTTIKRLLAATDLSTRSERALRRAALLARDFAADLQILHVVDDDGPSGIAEDRRRAAYDALHREEKVVRDLAGFSPTASLRVGDPFHEISTAAAETDSDLIVMGSHRRRILGDVFVGTTVERVMRTGPHPVLMVNAEAGRPYQRVLVAVDLSEPSGRALLAARELGLLDGAEVAILHAFSPLAKGLTIYAGIERERVEEYVLRETEGTRDRLVSFLEGLDLGALRYRARLEEGSAYAAIRRVVQDESPDLLVIGTRGLTGARRVLLGSVAHEILRASDTDVLAVPSRPDQGTASAGAREGRAGETAAPSAPGDGESVPPES